MKAGSSCTAGNCCLSRNVKYENRRLKAWKYRAKCIEKKI